MKKILFALVISLSLSSCARIYIVREKTIAGILEEIKKAPNQFRAERVVVSGWAIDGFEHCAIYQNREDLIGNRYDKSLWIEGGLHLPFLPDDPDKNGGFTYRICRVTIEGTVIYYPNLHGEKEKSVGTTGHMGLWTASLIDDIITIKSPVETKVWDAKIIDKSPFESNVKDPFK